MNGESVILIIDKLQIRGYQGKMFMMFFPMIFFVSEFTLYAVLYTLGVSINEIPIYSLLLFFLFMMSFFMKLEQPQANVKNISLSEIGFGDLVELYNKSTKKNEIMLVIDVQKNLLRVANMDDMNFTESEISNKSHEFVRKIK